MKHLRLTVISTIIVVGLAGCASQKEVQNTTDDSQVNTSYTRDNTISAKEEEPAQEPNAVMTPKIHVVQKGESLWVIAKKYGVTVKAIAEANDIENTSLIKVNQELIIPNSKRD